jgi:hypothetical protein
VPDRSAPQSSRLADNVWRRGEPVAPESRTQHDEIVMAGHVVSGREEPSTLRRGAEDLEDRRRHFRPVHTHRLAGKAHGKVARAEQSDCLERLQAGAPRVEGRVRQRQIRLVRRHSGVLFPHLHDSIGPGIWQGPQQDPVGGREDRRRGADAEPERQDSRGEEAPVASDRGQQILHVRPQLIQEDNHEKLPIDGTLSMVRNGRAHDGMSHIDVTSGDTNVDPRESQNMVAWAPAAL